MKKETQKTISTIAFTILFSAIVTLGCKSPALKSDSAKEKSSNENTNQVQDSYKADIDNFKKDINQKISENEKTIAGYKDQMIRNKKDVQASYNEQIENLEKKNLALKKRMDEYKEDSKENWNSFKAEFNHDMDELGKSLKDFTVNNKN
jgi:phage host-nuclease inhibitor protein Gam